MTRHISCRRPVRSLLPWMLGVCGLLVPALVSTRAADPVVPSGWLDTNVTVDGSIADWTRLARIGTGPAMAARNDDHALYLAIATDDVTVRTQLATGLIVWMDGTARKRQTFGLRLEGLAPRPIPGASAAGSSGELSDGVRNTLRRFDLLGPARLQRRLIDDAADVGMALASGVEDDMMIYELKVPLQSTADTPHAIGVKPGDAIAIGIETPEPPRRPRERNRLANPMSTSPWVQDPWGYGGYFSQPPPPPGGWSKPPKDVELKPMDLLWATVQLAAGMPDN